MRRKEAKETSSKNANSFNDAVKGTLAMLLPPSFMTAKPRASDLDNSNLAESDSTAVQVTLDNMIVGHGYEDEEHSDIQFNAWRGLCMFALHLFTPLSIPMVRWLHGKQGATNMGMFDASPANFIFHYAIAFLAWYPLIQFFSSPATFLDAGINTVEVLSPFALYVTWRVSVGVKYAYLSESQFHMFITCPDPDYTGKMQSRTQLLSGWMPLPFDLIHSQLRLTSKTLGIDLSSMQFYFFHKSGDAAASKGKVLKTTTSDNIYHSNTAATERLQHFTSAAIKPPALSEEKKQACCQDRSFVAWWLNKYYPEGQTPEIETLGSQSSSSVEAQQHARSPSSNFPSPDLRLFDNAGGPDIIQEACNSETLITAILRKGVREVGGNPTMIVFQMVVAIVRILCAFFYRWNNGYALFGNTAVETTIILSTTFLSVFIYNLVCIFLVCTHMDLQRRYAWMQSMTDLLQIVRRRNSDVPQLDMRVPSNIFAWTYTLIILVRFGRKYFLRLMVYTSLVLGGILTLFFVFVQRVSVLPKDEVLGSLVFLWFLLDTLFFVSILISIIRYGAMANKQFNKQKFLLVQHRLQLRGANEGNVPSIFPPL